ncbi:anti-sigma factor family protein, partial [Pyxidicoccus sp. 3LFB2]
MSTSEPMDIHDQVQAFADGELSPEEADTFRGHLGTCTQCQADLDDILQLQALGGRLAALEAKEAEVPQPIREAPHAAAPSRAFRPAWSRRRNLVAAVALTGSLAAV